MILRCGRWLFRICNLSTVYQFDDQGRNPYWVGKTMQMPAGLSCGTGLLQREVYLWAAMS